MQEVIWNGVISSKQTDSAFGPFINKFTYLYDKIFENSVVTVKLKILKSPWITKEVVLKSSKTKQRLYDKFLNSKTYEHEKSFKN